MQCKVNLHLSSMPPLRITKLFLPIVKTQTVLSYDTGGAAIVFPGYARAASN